MKTELSSRLTFLYKIFGLLFSVSGAVLTIGLVIAKRDPLGLLMLLIFLLPIIITYRLSKITFDDNFVYVQTWLNAEKFELKKVKSINEGNLASIDPYFQLEILTDDNKTIRKIEFAPKNWESLEYLFRKKYVGRLLMFKRHVERARDNDQNA